MKKPDDDLKIDISEIFGGDISEISSENGERSVMETPSQADSTELTGEMSAQYKEWFAAREKELENKAKDLEKRLQELQNQISRATSENKTSEAASLTLPSEIGATSGSDQSPVDFNAPIRPPFFGSIKSPALKPDSNTEHPTDRPKSKPGTTTSLDLDGLQSDMKLLMFYDEFRAIIAHEISDLVGERKTTTMLERTFEIARGKYPAIFKNANWDSSGNLLNDGSLNSQKIVENKSLLWADEAGLLLDSALATLLNLRLQSIEKGLGIGLKNKVRAHLFHWLNEKIENEKKLGNDISMLKRLSGYIP